MRQLSYLAGPALCLALFLGTAAAAAADAHWPVPAALSRRLALRPAQPLSVALPDAQGRPLYQLDCREQPGAIVHCALVEAGKPGGASLLLHAGLRDRGAFRERDLQGACAAYPQYGRQRSFRLRGFELSLALVDLPAVAGGPPGRALQVDLHPDPQALAAEAEAPAPPDPDSPGHGCLAAPPAADPFSCRKPEVEVPQPSCTQ